jgi:predicted nucleic acid-binding Zn ribbon protein
VFHFREIEPQPVPDPAPTELPPITVQHPGPLSTRVDVVQPSVAITDDPTACPECGGKAKVASTRPAYRRMKCSGCGHAFKISR